MWNNAFYSDLLELCRQEALDIRAKYAELYRIFLEILKEKTRDCSFDFSGPFARRTISGSMPCVLVAVPCMMLVKPYSRRRFCKI